MQVELEDWKNGWMGVHLALRRDEIDPLTALLAMLKQEPDQHFHLTSDYKGTGGLGDITIYGQSADERENMEMPGKALSPGTEIDLSLAPA